MSIWSDIEDRSSGDIIRGEDFHQVYPGNLPEKNLIEDDKYKDQEYMIFTNGSYPYIIVNIDRLLSAFAGAGIVKIDDKNGNEMTLKRKFGGQLSRYIFELNRDEDFVLDDHNGKIYTLDVLRDIAKDIIDQILKYEDDFKNRE